MMNLSLESLKISETTPVISKLTSYDYQEKPNIVAEPLLVKELGNYVASVEKLNEIKCLASHRYGVLKNYVFFTKEQASKMAQTITIIKKFYTDTKPIYVSRKKSKQEWKIIFDTETETTKKVVLLIHKKNLFCTELATYKIGRVAIKLLFDGTKWTSSPCYHLCSKNGKDTFYSSISIEDEIYKKFGAIVPKRLHNYLQSNSKHVNKRSCFYELHQCLYNVICDGLALSDYRRSKRILQGIADAILFVHNSGYICGDIKELNILLGQDDRIILCDTDTFRMVDMPNHKCFTREYLAPEAFLPNIDKKKAEVFSFGCILHFFATKKDPNWFSRNRTFWQEVDGPVYSKKALEAKSLLVNEEIESITIEELLFNLAFWCLSPSPENRPDMNTVCTQLKRHCSNDK